MLNMDMVGRLNDSTHALTVGGVGTSPIWGSVVRKDEYFRIATDSSGVGPSDHTSFYHAGVPVLFFFTGTHRDYHKPSDDADKINYEGTARVISYIYNIVKNMDAQPKPVFTPTRQTATGKVRFRVTLGITPDYAYQEEGVRVDGVTDGKPAAVAGIQAGDIVIRLGEHKITGMQSYMEALGSFKAGDKTEVVILRGAEQKTLPIEFR
jgi:aminopeptidase YwaD